MAAKPEWKVFSVERIIVTGKGMRAEGSVEGKRARLNGVGNFANLKGKPNQLRVRWPIPASVTPNDVKA